MLRWEPFVSRYMISYLAVLCPAIACQLELACGDETDGRWRRIGIIICTLVYFVSITEATGLIQYHTEIALGSSRHSGYFSNNEYVEENYRDVVAYIEEKDYKNIGLLLGGNTYEYPLTVMLEDYDRIEHVNVNNRTSIYEDETFVPEIIISMGCGMTEERIECHGISYEVVEKVAEDVYLLEMAK